MMRTSTRFLLVTAIVVAALLAAPAIATAATFRSGDTVVIGPNERIDDDLYISGNNVQMLGTVTGDVVAAGQNVEVGGNVGNGVMAAGQNVRVTGDIGGTVRVAGSNVTITSRVAQDVLAFGQNVTLAQSSSVERDAIVGATTASLDGDILRNLMAGATSVSLSGSVGGDAKIEAQDLNTAPGSEIKGNLTYSANSKTLNGTVGGQTVETVRPQRERPQPRNEGGGFGALIFLGVVYWIRSLIGYIIFGLIAVLVFRRFTSDSTDALTARPWPSLGWGALVVFGFPFVFVPALLLGIAIGGWWIAVLALFAWFTLLAFGLIVGALCIGRLIVSRGEHKPHDVWPMLLGLLILWVAWIVPFLGGLAVFGAMVFGVGAVVVAIAGRRASRSPQPTPAEQAQVAPYPAAEPTQQVAPYPAAEPAPQAPVEPAAPSEPAAPVESPMPTAQPGPSQPGPQAPPTPPEG